VHGSNVCVSWGHNPKENQCRIELVLVEIVVIVNCKWFSTGK